MNWRFTFEDGTVVTVYEHFSGTMTITDVSVPGETDPTTTVESSDPCAAKTCGETCSYCEPGSICAAVVMYCDASLSCNSFLEPECPSETTTQKATTQMALTHKVVSEMKFAGIQSEEHLQEIEEDIKRAIINSVVG